MKKILLVTIALLALASATLAQSTSGNIRGQIVDPKGSVVAGASVTLRNKATGAERTAVSNADGNYAFPIVQPGDYAVTVMAGGFNKTSVDVRVAVALDSTADIALQLQGATAIVEVVGDSAISVQTESPQLSTSITSKQLANLPTIDRNPYGFIGLTPGASSSNEGRGAGVAINGSRSSAGNFILDGGENNDTFVAGIAQSVPLDAVQEYTIQTNNYTAEYGRNAGFIANVATKGGSNEFHGTGYIYNRNSRLAANSFDNNAKGLKRGNYNRNQYGFSFGGPVIKDKLHFFAAIEPTHVRSVAPVPFFVVTPQLLAISAPGTQAIFTRFPLPTSGFTSSPAVNRTLCQFPLVVAIDPATMTTRCQNPTTLLFTDRVSVPSFREVAVLGPTDAGGGSPQNQITSSFRVDYNVSDKTQFFGRYAYQNIDQSGRFAGTRSYVSALNQANTQRNQNMLVNLTHTFSSNFITESRLVYNRILGPINPLTPANPTLPGFVFLAESASLPAGASSFGGPQNVYQLFQTANWITGNHNVKFGGQYVQIRDNRSFGAYETAEAAFTNAQGFVNGILSRYTIAVNPQGRFPGQTINPPIGPPSFTRHFRYNELGVFIQDTWKVTSRLTLTPGLRWEYFGVLHSTGKERPLDANFYLGSGSTFAARVASGAFRRTQDQTGNLKNRFYRPDYKDFGPRFGAAYDLTGNGKTVIRGGVGYFYDRNFGNVVFNAIQNPPNYATVRITNVPVTAALVSNQYAPFGGGAVTLRASSARYLSESLKTAYTIAYNVTFEHELNSKLVVGASYVGSTGKRLYSLNNVNRLDSIGLINPSALNPICLADASCGRLNTSATSINERGNGNSSRYNALQVRLDSRFIDRLGVQFGFNYTLSKSTDNGSSFFGDDAINGFIGFGATDPFNFNTADKGPSDFDARHRFVGNFAYELPFFKDKSGIAKALLHGFTISGVIQGQTGAPYGVFDVFNTEETVENTRPILRGSLPVATLRPDAQLPNTFLVLPLPFCATATSTNCFTNGTTVNRVEPGTLARSPFRRPGTRFADFAILKDFAFPTVFGHEGVKFQIRTDLFNAFNHSNLYVNVGTNEINTQSFFPTATGAQVEGVTANRGIQPNGTREGRTISFTGKIIF